MAAHAFRCRDFLDMVSPFRKRTAAPCRVHRVRGFGLLVFPPMKVLRSRTEVQRVRPAGYRLTLRARSSRGCTGFGGLIFRCDKVLLALSVLSPVFPSSS